MTVLHQFSSKFLEKKFHFHIGSYAELCLPVAAILD